LLGAGAYPFSLKSGQTSALLGDLETLALDVVLTTEVPQTGPQVQFAAQRIAEGFENLVTTLGIKPHIAATVDDMAMVRLLAREGIGVAIAPAVVVAEELASGLLATAPFDLGLSEPFFAVTLPRRFPHPALKGLLIQQPSLKGD